METDFVKELVAWKIPALSGKDAKTNSMILETLALQGPQTVWNVNRLLGRRRDQYPTIFRAMNRLKKRRYLAKTGSVKMEKRKSRTPTFGLTWRGLFGALANDKVRSDLLNVIDINNHIALPFRRDIIRPIATELWGDEQIADVARSLFEGFVIAIPYDIESGDETMLIASLFPAAVQASPIVFAGLDEKDLTVLFKYREVANLFEKMIDRQIETFEDNLRKLAEVKRFLSTIRTGKK